MVLHVLDFCVQHHLLCLPMTSLSQCRPLIFNSFDFPIKSPSDRLQNINAQASFPESYLIGLLEGLAFNIFRAPQMLLMCGQDRNTTKKYWVDKLNIVAYPYRLDSTVFWPQYLKVTLDREMVEIHSLKKLCKLAYVLASYWCCNKFHKLSAIKQPKCIML